jgi:hypothetical protein
LPLLISGISGAYDCSRDELRNGDVVRMAVTSFRPEADSYVRSYPPDLAGNLPNGDSRVYLVDASVGVTQHGHLTDTQYMGRASQLRLTHTADLIGVARFP